MASVVVVVAADPEADPEAVVVVAYALVATAVLAMPVRASTAVQPDLLVAGATTQGLVLAPGDLP